MRARHWCPHPGARREDVWAGGSVPSRTELIVDGAVTTSKSIVLGTSFTTARPGVLLVFSSE